MGHLRCLEKHTQLKNEGNAQIRESLQVYGSWFGSLNVRIKLSISYGGRVRT